MNLRKAKQTKSSVSKSSTRNRSSDPKTSVERMWLCRQKKKEDLAYESEAEVRETAERVRGIRAKKRAQEEYGADKQQCSRTCKIKDCMLHPERDRKRKYRAAREESPALASSSFSKDGAAEKKRQKMYTSEKRASIEKLTISVSKLTNEKRRLQRKSRRLEAFVAEQDEEVREEDEEV